MANVELERNAQKVFKKIKVALINKDLTQVDMSKIVDVSPVKLNRAIHGEMSPKSQRIRKQIFKYLNIKVS
ncbi:helix-turn-helix domain-containing protein [Fructilactobacillus fructivorans]|uniref:helix-turn-helix domain-containing protein n=1 Tax=Fructilactobacillus fructivorans TaxID=1614 RepID=UPI0007050757|nr:helix-turn-helix transcriptional regulator [Fructilactobacillus fructivorans]KRN39619.1 hypothetical protein IV51_GL000986 [Fructilactobacillus fructivorans]KRN43339.1 hypothetical protein IV48_GL000572 [Fructilactobacillus fructivorans]